MCVPLKLSRRMKLLRAVTSVGTPACQAGAQQQHACIKLVSGRPLPCVSGWLCSSRAQQARNRRQAPQIFCLLLLLLLLLLLGKSLRMLSCIASLLRERELYGCVLHPLPASGSPAAVCGFFGACSWGQQAEHEPERAAGGILIAQAQLHGQLSFPDPSLVPLTG